MRRTLDRYLLKEILGPLALGFLGYTFVLLMQFLFRSADMIVRRGVPAATVGELILLSLPNMVVLTIPMALLFAILVSIGRLSAGSELTAMRASGVSLFSLYRPILLLSLLLFALNSWLMQTALPWGNSRVQALTVEILRDSAARQVDPRVFHESWKGLTIYVFETAPEDGRWHGVFVADSGVGAAADITVAEWGEVRVDEDSEQLVLYLENAEQHRVDLNEPDSYEIYFHRSLRRVVDQGPTYEFKLSKSLRSLTLSELREITRRDTIHPTRLNLARVEIHKKFSIPAACVVFALIALPLGFTQQRGGRASGFAVSIVIILAYYVLLNNGEEAAANGKMEPWLAMWLPNFAFFAIGLFLLVRKNRDQSLILGQIDRWLGRHFWRLVARLKRSSEDRKARARLEDTRRLALVTPRRTDLVLKLPRFRLRFPNIMDRYVARSYFKILTLVTLSSLSLKLIADLTERVDDIMENELAASLVFRYYRYLSLQIAFELAPIAVLITTMIVFGLLSRNNEVIAVKSLGTSLYRLSLPVLAASMLVVAFFALLEARVLPATNAKVAWLDDLMRGRSVPRTYRRADRNWLFGQGRYIYNYLHYDTKSATLQRLQVFEFDDRHRLGRRLYSAKASYLGDTWRFDGAWKRTFDRSGERLSQKYTPASGPVLDRYPETPEYFESEFKHPNAMTYGELQSYIEEIRESGQAVPDLETELHNKIGYPASILVMAFLALPFSFRLGRRGALYGMGVGVVLGMVFLGIYAFSRTLGEAGALPPLIAIWSPSVAFVVFSVWMFLGIET